MALTVLAAAWLLGPALGLRWQTPVGPLALWGVALVALFFLAFTLHDIPMKGGRRPLL
jgi:hypothetical protein